MILSILIPSMHKRAGMLDRLIKSIPKSKDIEIITDVDDGRVCTGKKRNDLIKAAKGEYVVFIDDDDEITPDYIPDILKAAALHPDCIVFKGWMTTDGADRKDFRLSINYPYTAVWENGKEVYLRFPNHICPIKRSIASMVKFPNVTMGEDYAFALALHERGLLKTEEVIDKFIYHYKYKTVKP
jgi:GT2 family glycosyltransferase